jgi:hypothetical protein
MTKKMTSAIAAHLSTATYKRLESRLSADGNVSSTQSVRGDLVHRADGIYQNKSQRPGRCQEHQHEAGQDLNMTATKTVEHHAMTNDLRLTDLELTRLHSLLAGDIESTRVELHHTDDRAYKDQLKRRSEQDKALLAKMESAAPTLGKIPPD